MRGWIILAIIAGVLYYLATETNKLDEPMAKTDALLQKIERKLNSMTGTKLIRVDNKVSHFKREIAQRMSTDELKALDDILESEYTLKDFKEAYCNGGSTTHDSFSKDNILFICDRIR